MMAPARTLARLAVAAGLLPRYAAQSCWRPVADAPWALALRHLAVTVPALPSPGAQQSGRQRLHLGAAEALPGAQLCARRAHSSANSPRDAAPDFYGVMGMQAASFRVDVGDLERKYRALQFRLHPDKAASGSQAEQDTAAEQSALVNQAYDVLKSPLKRALHLLEREGALGDLGGEQTIEDMELLQRVLEAREQVEAAAHEADLAGPREDNRREEQECVQALTAAFEQGDLAEAATLTKQLRYITRIGEAIRDKG